MLRLLRGIEVGFRIFDQLFKYFIIQETFTISKSQCYEPLPTYTESIPEAIPKGTHGG